MKRLTLYSILSLLIFSSCTDFLRDHFKDKMTNSWKFSHMNNADTIPADFNSKMIGIVYTRFHYGYLRLYGDHKYTFLGENVSAMHSWSFNKVDSTLTIDSFIDIMAVRFKVLENDHEWLKMNITGLGNKDIRGEDNTFLFANDPYFEYGDQDLLTYPLNTWRIKPIHKENHKEIMKRVTAHVDFLIAYYQMIEDDHRNSFMPMYLQTIFKFYQNGIAIDNEEYMDDKWESCFYDHKDAAAGRKILVDAINSMGQYPDAKNYTEGYLKALKKMKEFLGKIN